MILTLFSVIAHGLNFRPTVFAWCSRDSSYLTPALVLSVAEPNRRGNPAALRARKLPLPPPANKDSISTPELGGVFRPAGRKPAWVWCSLIAMASSGRRGNRRSPESPGTVRYHLYIVVALGEEGQTDLTP
jgi:hypothetical protein